MTFAVLVCSFATTRFFPTDGDMLPVRLDARAGISFNWPVTKRGNVTNIVLAKLRDWSQGKSPLEARISIYNKIRDIPYAIVPELIHHRRYAGILTIGKGSCTPKHFLLCEMYRKLGITVLYACYPFRWDEVKVDYPPTLKKMARTLPPSYHVACKAEIDGKMVLIDATLDPAMEHLGLPVNKNWDGISDTLLPIVPCGDEQLYHPNEASQIRPSLDSKWQAFYKELNVWLAEVRKSLLYQSPNKGYT